MFDILLTTVIDKQASSFHSGINQSPTSIFIQKKVDQNQAKIISLKSLQAIRIFSMGKSLQNKRKLSHAEYSAYSYL